MEQVEWRLCQLNPWKDEGPDDVLTWLLREYAHLLAPPTCTIYDSSSTESQLPAVWHCATVVPMPKRNPPKAVEKDLLPVSLTPVLAMELGVLCVWVDCGAGWTPTGWRPILGHQKLIDSACTGGRRVWLGWSHQLQWHNGQSSVAEFSQGFQPHWPSHPDEQARPAGTAGFHYVLGGCIPPRLPAEGEGRGTSQCQGASVPCHGQ